MDRAHRWTDEELEKLERRIASVYREARDSLDETVKAYFESFAERDEEMRKLIGQTVNGKEWTEQDYLQWRLNQIGRGERFQALREKIAERMTQANQTAIAYVNDATPGIYSLNRNYAAYTIEKVAGNVGFTLWDESTVRRLIVEEPDLMPYYPKKKALKRGIDLKWGKQQITKSITQGILQGKSVGKIATDLQARVTEMNRVSAVRAARTAITSAENGGRMDSYKSASDMGIKVRKRWVATKDGRTRHSHRRLDGQTVDWDESFTSELGKIRYPGDQRAKPANTYNCRCTMRTVEKDGIEAEPRQMRVRDPKTGKNVLINEMTYDEWEDWKKSEDPKAWELHQKKSQNYASDKKQFEEYKKRLGKNAPKSIDDFQEIKYTNPEKYSTLKEHYRYKGRVTEATEEDFKKYQKVKETGVIGTIRVPPQKVDSSTLTFRDEHAAHHGCTVEEARGFVKTAYCSVTRKKWDGFSINFYSANGAAYIDKDTLEIKTSFPRSEYDPTTKGIVEVFE